MASLGIPVSNATARVRMVDTTGVMLVKSAAFIQPVQKGHETLSLYVAAFLIDHPASGRKIMFDLGVRKDYWTLPALLQTRLGTFIPGLRVDKDTTEVLQEQGISLDEICMPATFPRVLTSFLLQNSLRCMVTLPLGPHRLHGVVPGQY